MLRTALAAVILVAGCRDVHRADPGVPDAALADDAAAGYPPPRSDLVPAVGSPDTLDIATWNIENFPDGPTTPATVADLITSLDLDVLVVEEIASDTAWAELLARLRGYSGVLSSHRYTATEYQKIGVLYRTAMVTPGPVSLLFQADTNAFPRPPLAVPLTVDDHVHPPLAFEVIGVHLKAGTAAEDGERRRLAVEQLDAHLRAQVDGGGEAEVMLAGDYNEVVTTATGQANLAALLTAPERYTIHTQAAASAGQISFVPTRKLFDHITTTAALTARTAGAHIVIPRLDGDVANYVDGVSDHLPVVLVAPL